MLSSSLYLFLDGSTRFRINEIWGGGGGDSSSSRIRADGGAAVLIIALLFLDDGASAELLCLRVLSSSRSLDPFCVSGHPTYVNGYCHLGSDWKIEQQ